MIHSAKKYLPYFPLFYILFFYVVCSGMDYFISELTSQFILTVISAFCLGAVSVRKNVFRFNRLDLSLLLFALWYTIVISIKSAGIDRWFIVQSVTYILIYLYFRNIRLNGLFSRSLFIAGIFQAVWVLLQKNGILFSNHYLLDITGGFFNPGILAIFLVLALLAGLTQWKPQLKKGVKCLLALGYVLLTSCIVLADSRASWVALSGGCVWLFLVGKERGKTSIQTLFPSHSFLKNPLLLTVAGILTLTATAVLYYIRPDSVQGRILIWQVIGSRLPQSLWTGQGTLQAVYMPMQAQWFQTNPDSTLTKFAGNNIYAFNEFLRIIFESGIIGLMLFTVLCAMGIYAAIKGNKHARQAGSLLVAGICFGLFSYPLSVPVLASLSLTVQAIISQNSFTSCRIRSGKIRWVIFFLLGLFLIFAVREYTFGKKADRLLKASRQNPYILTDVSMCRCYEQLQNNPDFILGYGKNLYEHGLYGNAGTVLERGYRLRPSSGLVCDLGECYQRDSLFSQAEQAYTLAAFMTPAYIMPRYRLFCLYKAIGQHEKALEQANVILTMPVKLVNSSVLRVRNEVRTFLKNHSSPQWQ